MNEVEAVQLEKQTSKSAFVQREQNLERAAQLQIEEANARAEEQAHRHRRLLQASEAAAEMAATAAATTASGIEAQLCSEIAAEKAAHKADLERVQQRLQQVEAAMKRREDGIRDEAARELRHQAAIYEATEKANEASAAAARQVAATAETDLRNKLAGEKEARIRVLQVRPCKLLEHHCCEDILID